jgi:hypothetical protein
MKAGTSGKHKWALDRRDGAQASINALLTLFKEFPEESPPEKEIAEEIAWIKGRLRVTDILKITALCDDPVIQLLQINMLNRILKDIETLTIIDFSNQSMATDAIDALRFPKSITNINLQNCALTPIKMGMLKLPRHTATLNLAGNKLTIEGLNACPSLAALSRLVELELSNNSLGAPSEHTWDAPPTVRTLRLKNNNLSPQNIKQIVLNKKLKTLELGNNGVNQAHILALTLPKELETLDLDGSEMDIAGVKLLLEKTKKYALNHVDLRNNPKITEEALDTITPLIESSECALKSCYVDNDPKHKIKNAIRKRFQHRKDGKPVLNDFGRQHSSSLSADAPSVAPEEASPGATLEW